MPDGFQSDSEIIEYLLAGTPVCFQMPRSLLLRFNSIWGWNKLIKTCKRPHELKTINPGKRLLQVSPLPPGPNISG